jgi:UDP-N-acetylmuramyl pentapeptide phosphotransferase/UDP-N-acetylglucosamine-1-phosphate transferase
MFCRVALRDRMLIFLPFKSFWDTPPLHMRFRPGATTVVTRFWILGILCALVALATLKVR